MFMVQFYTAELDITLVNVIHASLPTRPVMLEHKQQQKTYREKIEESANF